MLEISIKMSLPQGLHMRPAGIFVHEASKFKSKITIFNDDQMADGKSIMGLLTLGLTNGSVMKIVVEGIDEEAAIHHLEKIVKETLVKTEGH